MQDLNIRHNIKLLKENGESVTTSVLAVMFG
jgi:hypothetical protein